MGLGPPPKALPCQDRTSGALRYLAFCTFRCTLSKIKSKLITYLSRKLQHAFEVERGHERHLQLNMCKEDSSSVDL